MNRIPLTLVTLFCFACSDRSNRENYAEGFLFVVEQTENDIEYLHQGMDSIKGQIGRTYSFDRAMFESTIGLTQQLNKKFSNLIDSLTTAEAYQENSDIKDKTISLIKIYRDEILTSCASNVTDHFNVYGRNRILEFEKPLQDSLNHLIIKTNEREMESLAKRIREGERFRNSVKDWIEG